MGWAIGYDERWKRDVGYGVPCLCDHPDCGAEIDRGLAYICGGAIHGGEYGCGLFFCEKHMLSGLHCQLCQQCVKRCKPFSPKPDTLRWLYHKMTHPSWEEWRKENGLVPDDLDAPMPGWHEDGLGYKPLGGSVGTNKTARLKP